MAPLLPYDPVRRVQIIGDLWKATRNGRTLTVELRTHPMGWELRGLVGLEIQRTQVCNTEPAVGSTSESWRTEAETKGWNMCPARAR